MAVLTPLLLDAIQGAGIPSDFLPFMAELNSAALARVHRFAPFAYANNLSGPSAKLEVNTANGTLMTGQPFVDTYFIAGTSTTRVDRFATEAETPNTVLVTDNYNRIRVVYDSVSLPTSDTNNLQYPLYLHDVSGVMQLRAMTRQDFIDSFVIPALDISAIWSAATTNAQSGTYFLTTSTSPANATLVSATPVAVNSVADLTAYTAGGIPEVQKQTIDTNYYLARLDFAATTYDIYDAEQLAYDLPLYFDAGTESIRQHTPTTWAALIGPFLRYYLATPGTGYAIEYNLTDGNQRGTTYTDSRIAVSSTGYAQRFVNDDDYRTQEFPIGGTTEVISTKAFYIKRNNATWNAIFGYGSAVGAFSLTNLVLSTGVVGADTTGVGTARSSLAAAGYGGDKVIFGYGRTFSPSTTYFSITNLVSALGGVLADTTGVGTERSSLAAAGYGGDKAIFAFGRSAASNDTSHVNLVSNTGVVSADFTSTVYTARESLAAASYGGDKAIFAFGTTNGFFNVSLTNLVSNTGVVSGDFSAPSQIRNSLAAAGYGGDKAIFGYGTTSSSQYYSVTNLVSNTGVVSADTTGVGTARSNLAAAGYGGDKAIFGYGVGAPSFTRLSVTNLVSNTGVVSADTTGVGTARSSLAAGSFG